MGCMQGIEKKKKVSQKQNSIKLKQKQKNEPIRDTVDQLFQIDLPAETPPSPSPIKETSQIKIQYEQKIVSEIQLKIAPASDRPETNRDVIVSSKLKGKGNVLASIVQRGDDDSRLSKLKFESQMGSNNNSINKNLDSKNSKQVHDIFVYELDEKDGITEFVEPNQIDYDKIIKNYLIR